MKQKFLLFAAILMAAIFLGSCNPNNDPKTPEEKEYESEIDFTEWDVAVAGIGDEVLSALLKEYCPDYTTVGTEDIELFLLGAYASSYDSQIDAVLDGGGACVLTENLTIENIEAFLEACGYDANYAKGIEKLENLEMFGVSGHGDVYIAYHEVHSADEEGFMTETTILDEGPDAGKDAEEKIEVKEGKKSLYETSEYGSLYGIYSWLKHSYEERAAYEEYEPEYETDEDFLLAPLKAGDQKGDGNKDIIDPKSIERIAQGNTYTLKNTISIPKWKMPDHKGRTQEDFLYNAHYTVVANYTIHQLFVYPGSTAGANSGDYYVVNANVEWMNRGMYKGVDMVDHGGWTNRRYCGFIPHYCSFETTPVLKSGYTINIPANGSVLPETVNRETTHTETRSFNLGLNASIGAKGSGDKETKGRKSSTKGSKGIEGNAGLTMGWGWNHTKNYTKKDWNIVKEGAAPSAGHKLEMDDDCLPAPMHSDPGFENVKEIYSSTFNVHESWIWHIPETQTESEDAPLKIKLRSVAEYTWMDHFITKDTRITKRYEFRPIEDCIAILPTNRVSAGVIKIVNNMERDGQKLTVSNVTFLNADDIKDTLFVDNNNTYRPDREMTYGMLSKYNYEIHFMAGRKRSDARWYKLVDNKSVGPNETIVIDDLDYDAEEVK